MIENLMNDCAAFKAQFSKDMSFETNLQGQYERSILKDWVFSIKKQSYKMNVRYAPYICNANALGRWIKKGRNTNEAGVLFTLKNEKGRTYT